ncbi:MAG: hypothetical protein B7Z43_07080 [Sphingomonas sp. 12-62-6]|nr:MAG: hypothetical protein B7Z43_07080 [Sphingomonas sp. 12-62-6]
MDQEHRCKFTPAHLVPDIGFRVHRTDIRRRFDNQRHDLAPRISEQPFAFTFVGDRPCIRVHTLGRWKGYRLWQWRGGIDWRPINWQDLSATMSAALNMPCKTLAFESPRQIGQFGIRAADRPKLRRAKDCAASTAATRYLET